MKKKKWTAVRLLSGILAASMALTPNVIAADGETYDAQVQSFDDQIFDIQNKQQQAQSELAAIRSDQSKAWEEMDKIDEMISYNNQMKALAEGQLDTINEQLNDTVEEIADTEQKIAAQEDAFLERMVQNYMDDGTDYIELLLGSENLIDFLTKLDRVNAIMDYDRNIITNLSGNKEKLEEARARQEQSEEEQRNKVSVFENAIQQNQSLYSQKQEYVDTLLTDEAKFMEQYSYYKEKENEIYEEQMAYLAYLAEQQRLEAERKEQERREREEAERLAREQAEREAAAAAAAAAAAEEAAAWQWQQEQWENANSYGSYYYEEEDDYDYGGSYYDIGATCWPLEQGVRWQVSSTFGWRTLYGVTDFHLGIDLSCPNGTNVYAYAGGTVLKSEYHWSYGNYVLISHPNGTATRYAHMSENLVSAGETVKAGQHIGYVGLTGNTFGYHLHFEYIVGGEVTDPAPYLGI